VATAAPVGGSRAAGHRTKRGDPVDILTESAVSQGMVLASLIGGFSLAAIAQLVAAFPGGVETTPHRAVTAAVTWLAVAATIMMINVWSGIIFFLDNDGDREAIARVFYGGLFLGVALFALGMADTVSIRSPRLRLPILIMFGGLLLAELVLALAYLV
jgi:hypothetical protein